MRLLFCCLAFASVAVSFGMAKNAYQDINKLLGILRSATKNKRGWSDVQLSQEMFFEMLAIFIPQGSAKRYSELIFRMFDSDNSGQIDIKEVLLVLNNIVDATPEERLEWLFKIYDANRDGNIERSEMTQIIEIVYELAALSPTTEDPSDIPEGKSRDIVAEFDENNDGVLSKDEFFLGALDDESISQILNENFYEEPE